jgi:hypothetical protein
MKQKLVILGKREIIKANNLTLIHIKKIRHNIYCKYRNNFNSFT